MTVSYICSYKPTENQAAVDFRGPWRIICNLVSASTHLSSYCTSYNLETPNIYSPSKFHVFPDCFYLTWCSHFGHQQCLFCLSSWKSKKDRVNLHRGHLLTSTRPRRGLPPSLPHQDLATLSSWLPIFFTSHTHTSIGPDSSTRNLYPERPTSYYVLSPYHHPKEAIFIFYLSHRRGRGGVEGAGTTWPGKQIVGSGNRAEKRRVCKGVSVRTRIWKYVPFDFCW